MSQVNPQAIGKRVREARLAAGLSQQELAVSLGVSSALLSHYETGRRLLPLDTAFRFARAHRVSLDWLYGFRSARP